MASTPAPYSKPLKQGNALILINGKAKYAKRYGAELLQQRLTQYVQALSQKKPNPVDSNKQVRVEITNRHQELNNTLMQYPPGSLALVIPVGGDGTLSTVLTALWHTHGTEHLPAILAVHAGTMNQIANDIGPVCCPIQAIEQCLKQWNQQPQQPLLHTTTRHALCINHKHLGFAFGYGASAHFLQEYNQLGAGLRVAWRLIFNHMGHALRGAWRLPTQLGLALSVRKLPLGVKLSTSGGPNAQANFCWVHGQHVRWVRLALQLPWVWCGKLPANTGLQRSTQQHLCIQENQAQAWHLDGDLYPACTQLDITVGPAVEFVVLNKTTAVPSKHPTKLSQTLNKP